MEFTLTLAEAAGFSGLNLKKLNDDRVIMRRETGEDFLNPPVNGRTILGLDDCASLMFYADFRRAGIQVKVAGVIAAHLRAAMREYPAAPELTMVKLDDGHSFVRPSDDKGLEQFARAGRYPTFELVIPVRQLRERVLRAADHLVAEVVNV